MSLGSRRVNNFSRIIDSPSSRFALRYPRGYAVYVARPTRSILEILLTSFAESGLMRGTLRSPMSFFPPPPSALPSPHMPARRSCGEGGSHVTRLRSRSYGVAKARHSAPAGSVDSLAPAPMINRGRLLKRIALCFALAGLGLAQSARGAEKDWKSAGTDFNTDANWTNSGGGATTAPGLGDVAWFKTAETVNPNLSASKSIAGLYFNGTGSFGYDITRTNSAVFTLTGQSASGSNGAADSSAAAIRAENTSNTNTIDVPLILASSTNTSSFFQASGGTLVVNGDISGTGITLNLAGGGTVQLSGNNSYSGGTTVTGTNETVVLGSNTALGDSSGTFSITSSTGATVKSDSSSARTLANAISVGTVTLTFDTGGNLTFGAMTITGNRTIVVNNAITTVSSLSPDATLTRALTKQGTGALLVTGDKTNTGNIDIQGGMFGVAGNYTTTGILKLDGGVLGRNGTFSQSLGGSSTNVQWIASTSGGFAAYGTNATWGSAANNLAVNINNNGSTLTWGTANFLSSGQALILGTSASNGTVDFQNGLNLGGTDQNVQVNRGATAPAGGVDAKISGVIGSSGGGLTKTGLGTLQLTGNNSYTGATLISGGILELKNTSTTALSGTSGVTINNSGTLLFSANNQLNQTTPASISLGGGTGTPQINAGGVSQGTNATAGIGALTLSSNSTIDMTGNSLLHFGASTAAATGVLSILDWNGLVTGNSLTGGSSTDLLRFGTSNSNLSFISQIQFVDPNGVSGTFAAMFASGNPGEVVPDLATPVPEPSTWIGAALALGAIGVMGRKRLARLVKRV